MNFDWNAIRSFLRVAKTGTLSAAAADLGLSQPTVGRHISRLEESLGLCLFNHNQSGFQLTEAGEKLLSSANNMALSAADVQRSAEAANPNMKSVRIRIEVRPWSALLLSRNAAKLARQDNHTATERPINFDFIALDEYLSISSLEADLALRNRVPKQGNLISVKLGHLTHQIFASEYYSKQHPEVFDPASWQQHDWVGLGHTRLSSPSNKIISSILMDRDPRFVTNRLEVITEMISKGDAIGVLPTWIGRQEGFVPLTDKIYHPQEVWLVYHPDLKANPTKRRVKDRLQELVSETLGPWF